MWPEVNNTNFTARHLSVTSKNIRTNTLISKILQYTTG
jgi:hypothetical protein